MSENTVFSYTNRDYESSRKEGLSRIPLLSKGNYTDLNATDPGVILLDYVHALVDMINFYQDHQALETFLPTAKERSNIFRLAEQFSYKVISAKGATCSVKFTSPIIYDHPIKIPKNTKVRTYSGIYYLTVDDAYLPTGELSVSIPCEQGIIKTMKYEGTGVSRFSNNGTASNQSVIISEGNIDTDSITVVDSLGRVWKSVDYILFSNSAERAYQVKLNPEDTVSILFGDGERGFVPRESDTLIITYKVTSAEEGSVGVNNLTILESEILDRGRYVEFTVTNEESSVGGSSVQSSREIRELAPGAIKSQYRAVTLSDFENLAKLVNGVRDAKAYDMNTNETLLHHEVLVLIIPESSGSESLLKEKVYNYLYNLMIPPTNLKVITPGAVTIDISLEVKKVDYASEEQVEYDVRAAVEEYFEEISVNIGEDFYPASLSAKVSNLATVRYVTSIMPNTPVSIEDLAVPKLGTLSISVS